VKCQQNSEANELIKTYHVDALNGDRGVNDDTLASLVIVANNHLSPLVLVGNQGRDVGLDTTSSETDNDDSDDEASETRIVVESRRDGRAGKDEETDDVDTAEDDNGVVLSEILVGNDGTENGSNVAPELEEGGETSGSLVTHTERTTAFRSIAWTSDVVLENTGGSVVGETFA
jgi:hypothetical protein